MQISDLMQEYFTPSNQKKELFLESKEPSFSDWSVVDSPDRLLKDYSFPTRPMLFDFLRQLFLFEDSMGHHGKITIDHTSVRVEVYTHDINAVTELDTEYAAVVDNIYFDVVGSQ